MKKLVYLMGLMLAVSACQVRHDHSKQMQSVRVAVDTAQKNYVDDERRRYQRRVVLSIPSSAVRRSHRGLCRDLS